ncbi:hypothetical protein V7S43_015872 [Phytophthora oleae]|uniref:Uncharacterized protein n=1 Tax=Phytophthora oleae TaxID=2107226 RepID=A0ABD3EZ72_9STRA
MIVSHDTHSNGVAELARENVILEREKAELEKEKVVLKQEKDVLEKENSLLGRQAADLAREKDRLTHAFRKPEQLAEKARTVAENRAEVHVEMLRYSLRRTEDNGKEVVGLLVEAQPRAETAELTAKQKVQQIRKEPKSKT